MKNHQCVFNVATETLIFILFVCQNYDLQDFCQCMNKYILRMCVCVCVYCNAVVIYYAVGL